MAELLPGHRYRSYMCMHAPRQPNSPISCIREIMITATTWNTSRSCIDACSHHYHRIGLFGCDQFICAKVAADRPQRQWQGVALETTETPSNGTPRGRANV